MLCQVHGSCAISGQAVWRWRRVPWQEGRREVRQSWRMGSRNCVGIILGITMTSCLMNFGVTNRVKPWKIKPSVCKWSKKKIKLNSNNSKLYCPFTVSPSALLPLGISSVISINSRLNEHQRIQGMRGTCDSFFGFDEVKDSITLGKSN